MKNDIKKNTPNDKSMEMAAALTELRDAWVRMSLILRDFLAEQDVVRKGEALVEVELCLAKLRTSANVNVERESNKRLL